MFTNDSLDFMPSDQQQQPCTHTSTRGAHPQRWSLHTARLIYEESHMPREELLEIDSSSGMQHWGAEGTPGTLVQTHQVLSGEELEQVYTVEFHRGPMLHNLTRPIPITPHNIIGEIATSSVLTGQVMGTFLDPHPRRPMLPQHPCNSTDTIAPVTSTHQCLLD